MFIEYKTVKKKLKKRLGRKKGKGPKQESQNRGKSLIPEMMNISFKASRGEMKSNQ